MLPRCSLYFLLMLPMLILVISRNFRSIIRLTLASILYMQQNTLSGSHVIFIWSFGKPKRKKNKESVPTHNWTCNCFSYQILKMRLHVVFHICGLNANCSAWIYLLFGIGTGIRVFSLVSPIIVGFKRFFDTDELKIFKYFFHPFFIQETLK